MLDTFIGVWKCVEKILEPFREKILFFREEMRKFHPILRSPKWTIFWILLGRMKVDGTLPLCIRHAYNWYLLKAYDLGNMLGIISVWKCVEKNFRAI